MSIFKLKSPLKSSEMLLVLKLIVAFSVFIITSFAGPFFKLFNVSAVILSVELASISTFPLSIPSCACSSAGTLDLFK